MKSKGTVLLVEDNEEINHTNSRALKLRGYEVFAALTLAEARERISQVKPDIILLDITLPDGSGLDFLAGLRETSHIPVILLTAKGMLSDKLTGFEYGADDYLPKPYDYEELMARVDALLGRAAKMPERIVYKELVFDIPSGQALLRGKDLGLKPNEYKLLLFFAQNENKIMSAEELYQKVWNAPLAGNTSALRTCLSSLRSKIQPFGYDIYNIQSKGYYIE